MLIIQVLVLQVGAADIQVINSTAEENSVLVHHKCLEPLEHFLNLTLGVNCLPGSTDCGSVKNCSATGKVLPYTRFMLRELCPKTAVRVIG